MSGSSWLSNESFIENQNVKSDNNEKLNYLKSILGNVSHLERYAMSCFSQCSEKSEINNYSWNSDCARRCSQVAKESVSNFHIGGMKDEKKKEFL